MDKTFVFLKKSELKFGKGKDNKLLELRKK